MKRAHARRSDPVVELLHALRAAGCDVFIDDGALYCSPPLRRVEWEGDVEAAIEVWYQDIKAIVQGEARITIH